jgi:hypothetical protein
MAKNLTLKRIHAMFEVGQQWNAVNTYNEKASGVREVARKHATQLVWTTPTVPSSWMKLPMASQVIEARDGFLSFRLFSANDDMKYRGDKAALATVTLTRIDAQGGR